MPTYSISGTVFDDADGDGLQGGGEAGLSVRQVTWYFDNGGVWTTIADITTGAGGAYADGVILLGDPVDFKAESFVEAPYAATTPNPAFFTLSGATPGITVNFGWRQARQSFRGASSWVHQVSWVPGRGVQVAYHRGHGRPAYFECYYPGTTHADYLRFQGAGSLGRWAWHFYRRRPYVRVAVGS